MLSVIPFSSPPPVKGYVLPSEALSNYLTQYEQREIWSYDFFDRPSIYVKAIDKFYHFYELALIRFEMDGHVPLHGQAISYWQFDFPVGTQFKFDLVEEYGDISHNILTTISRPTYSEEIIVTIDNEQHLIYADFLVEVANARTLLPRTPITLVENI